MSLATLVVCALLGWRATADDGEQFDERLLIRPLPDHNVLLHFEFNMSIDRPLNADDEHYRLFPKSIAQVLTKHQADEFDISLTQGRWRYSDWGSPIVPVPSGAQLLAWIRKNVTDSSQASQSWKGLQQSLGGVLCSSLPQIGSTIHSSEDVPQSVFVPESDHISKQSHTAFYGVLPREPVCTENLTPWAKLLPGRTRAGLGSLLNPLDLHDGSFHSMGIRTYSRPSHRGRASVSSFWLSVVLDPEYLWRSKEWSLRTLLPHLKGPIQCSPLSSSCEVVLDTIYTDVKGGRVSGLTGPDPIRREGSLMVFDPNGLSLQYISGDDHPFMPATSSPILLQRHSTGRGLHHGGIVNTFVNIDTVPHRVVMCDVIPWYFRLYFHSLQVSVDSIPVTPSALHFRPGRQSLRPALIEMEIIIPSNGTAVFSISFDKAFLPIKDFPPDVARGFDLGPVIINIPSAQGQRRMYSESLVILLPGPDMSMPFNVIAFTSTFLAFFFGTMFNVLYRHPVELANRERGGLLMMGIRRLIQRVRGRRPTDPITKTKIQ